VLFPRQSAERAGGRASAHFGMEVHVDYHEEAEEEQLDEQPSDGDVGAFVERGDVAAGGLNTSTCMLSVSCLGGHCATVLTCALHHKRQNVAANENLCQPFLADESVVFAINQSHETAQLHVNRRRKQRRRDQDEQRLDDVRRQTPVRTLCTRSSSACVAYEFHCARKSVQVKRISRGH